jgi:hypothetical protein
MAAMLARRPSARMISVTALPTDTIRLAFEDVTVPPKASLMVPAMTGAGNAINEVADNKKRQRVNAEESFAMEFSPTC